MKTAFFLSAALMAIGLQSQAAETSHVSIRAYDCSVDKLADHNGKCEIEIVDATGKSSILTASPEVGAPWGNSYGPASCHPSIDLTVDVSKAKEILSVKDSSGETVSTKFDYSH